MIIEANPNPSLAREDDFAQSAAAAGLDYDALIQKILDTRLRLNATELITVRSRLHLVPKFVTIPSTPPADFSGLRSSLDA